MRTVPTHETAKICDIPVSQIDIDRLLPDIDHAIQAGRVGAYISITNTESMYHALRIPEHLRFIQAADYSLCDGVGVIAAGWAWGHRIRRLNGPILQLECCKGAIRRRLHEISERLRVAALVFARLGATYAQNLCTASPGAMKTLSMRVGTLLLVTLILAACSRHPANWTEGKSYTSLVPAQPTSVAPDKVEVVEVFWYGCGHCFHLDPILEDWRKQGKPTFVEFVRVPVMWSDATRAHARLFYTLEALGKLEQLHTAVFREIHINSHYLVDADPARTEQLQRAFLKANGVSDADFDRIYRSLSVESKLQRAEQLTRRYRRTGVPLVVVNGKYTADVGTAGGETRLLELVNDLAASERKR